MNYSTIKKYDISNGKGVRCSIFLTGCTHKCKGCFNSELWDFKAGKPFDNDAKKYLFELLADPHCVGLSVLGGEPLQQGVEMRDLLKEVRETFPDKDIWLWTGYYIPKELDALQVEITSYCDYVIDGRFDESKTDKKLLFRGSSNQTIWEKPRDMSGTWRRSSLNNE